MKLPALSLFFSLLLATTHAFNPLSLLQYLLEPRIPQFILDTNHPCLTPFNKARLSHIPFLKTALCDPTSTLWTMPATSADALPTDLFAHLVVDNYKGTDAHRPGWANAATRLHEIQSCEAALAGVRHLHVDLDPDWDPPRSLPLLAADVLAEMTGLERLDWGVSEASTRAFEAGFVERGLVLPSVRFLQPGLLSDYMVSRCPNLEVLAAGAYRHHWSWGHYSERGNRQGRLDLIKATTGLPLKEMRLSEPNEYHPGWCLGMLEGILDATPNITSLKMDGPLGCSSAYLQSLHSSVLQELLSVLRRFPNLVHLKLPEPQDLQLGFEWGPWCGNVFDGPEGEAFGRRLMQERAETIELAANFALAGLPNLRELLIGDQRVNLTLNDNGQPDLSWPWTGRMEQYVNEWWSN